LLKGSINFAVTEKLVIGGSWAKNKALWPYR